MDVLEDYLDGKLDAKTMHRVERLSLEDPFVAEALAGLSLSPKRVQSLSLLQKQLQDRIAKKPVEQKRWQITSQRLSIAAAAAVLFITVSLLFWMREKSNREQIAANTPKKVEVAIAPGPEKSKEEVDKVITEAKMDRYANQSKKVSVQRSLTLSSLTIPSSQNALVKGVVYDENKAPIPGASVKLNGASVATVTDAKGEFSLNLDSLLKDPKLNVAFLGYMPKEVNAKTGQTLAIELKGDTQTLNEIVVVGYGAQKKKMQTGSISKIAPQPEPTGGWGTFEEYIINNNKLLKDKKLTGRYITVSFKLNENAEPIDLRVIKSFNLIPPQTEAEEKEAIRLVKEGPKWILPANSSTSSKETIVNIKF